MWPTSPGPPELSRSIGDQPSVLACACAVYDAECALHAARMSGVGAWTSAASDKLHLAIERYEAAVAADRHADRILPADG